MSVFVAARDLAGAAFVGTHQFLVIVNERNPYPPFRNGFAGPVSVRSVGGGKLGWVVGGHNVKGRLEVKFFEAADHAAAIEHFDPARRSWYKADFDAELVKVTGDQAKIVDALIYRIDAYIINQASDPIRYPTAGMGFNSNSWAQTVIALAGGKVSSSDMKGMDVANKRRIPTTYFEPVCPAKPRPVVNP